MGGTEATVVRVAQALGEKLDVTVAQHGRNEYAVSQHVTYRPLSPNLLSQSWDHIVCLRTGRQVPWLRMKHPGTPLYVWLHDLPGVGLRELRLRTYRFLLSSLASITRSMTISPPGSSNTSPRLWYSFLPPTRGLRKRYRSLVA